MYVPPTPTNAIAPSPSAATAAGRRRRDADLRRRRQRLVLAGVRHWHNSACALGKSRRLVAIARGERRVHLHPRAFRDLGDRPPGVRRRETAAIERDGKRARVIAGLLFPRVGRGLGGHSRPGGAAALLGEDRPWPNAAGSSPRRLHTGSDPGRGRAVATNSC